MRLAAALTGFLLVMVLRVAVGQNAQLHRKVLQDTAPVTINGTIATALNETKAAGGKGVNATKAVNTRGNATANATSGDNRARGDGWGALGRGPVVCYESISCRKRMLMEAASAANESKAAAAEGTNATAVAVNATGAAAVNSTNVTGNASDVQSRRGFNNGGGYYSGSGTYATFSQADAVHCELVGCKKRRLLAVRPVRLSLSKLLGGLNAIKAVNATGNDNRSRRGNGAWGGDSSSPQGD